MDTRCVSWPCCAFWFPPPLNSSFTDGLSLSAPSGSGPQINRQYINGVCPSGFQEVGHYRGSITIPATTTISPSQGAAGAIILLSRPLVASVS